MNEDQLASVDTALAEASRIGPYQVALLQVAFVMTSAMRGCDFSDASIGRALDALGYLISAPRPDPVTLVDNHTRLMCGLGDSLRMLRDDDDHDGSVQ